MNKQDYELFADCRIKIYDEVWNAKSSNNCIFKTGEFVKIIKIDSLTMYVEKIGEEKCSE